GTATLYSGATGAVLNNVFGSPNSQMGTAVAGAGDFDGDGVLDWMSSARLDSTGGPNAGRVVVVSGSNGSQLLEVLGDANDYLGWSLAGAVNLDGDGHPDLVIGSQFAGPHLEG